MARRGRRPAALPLLRRALVVTLLLAGLPAVSASATTAPGSCAVAAAPEPYRTTVVGDSYTDVEPYADPAGEGWAHELAERMHWDLVARAVGGSGYVNPGLARRPWPEVAPAVLADDPDLVLLVGSRNDVTSSPEAVLAAARATHGILEELPADVPVVVVGPIWDAGAPALELYPVRNAVARSAAEHGLPFVDALEDGGWFYRRSDLFLPRDVVHPVPSGQTLLADRIGRALHELRVAPRGQEPLPAPGLPRRVRASAC